MRLFVVVGAVGIVVLIGRSIRIVVGAIGVIVVIGRPIGIVVGGSIGVIVIVGGSIGVVIVVVVSGRHLGKIWVCDAGDEDGTRRDWRIADHFRTSLILCPNDRHPKCNQGAIE